jgi:hypothetical protein
MDWLQKARDAVAIIAEGRKALGAVVDAVKDGKAGIDADTVGEIDALLEQERVENRATDAAITDAVARYRERHGG